MNAQVRNRKGRTSAKQKEHLKILLSKWEVPRGSLTLSCVSAFEDTLSLIQDRTPENPWTLFTDKNTAYPTAMKRVKKFKHLMDNHSLVHRTISSREPRTFANPLFPVNYSDREFRKNMAGHVRETVRFDRELNMGAVRMVIQIGNHGFRKPFRIGDRKDVSTYPSHADEAGITKNPQVILALRTMYLRRNLWSHQKTKKDWMRKVWLAEYKSPVHVDFETGEVSKSHQPGVRKLANHLRV